MNRPGPRWRRYPVPPRAKTPPLPTPPPDRPPSDPREDPCGRPPISIGDGDDKDEEGDT